MKKKIQDFKVGLFVSSGIALAMVAIMVLGGSESIFVRKTHFKSHFASSNGLIPGSKVVLSGVPAGAVSAVDFDAETKSISVDFTVELKYADFIREGSTVEIMTQGVLGDKYLSLNPGYDGAPLAEGSEIPPRPSQDLSQMLSKGDALMKNLTAVTASLDRVLQRMEAGNRIDRILEGLVTTSTNMARMSSDLDLKKSTKSLGEILEKINNGTGTLGAIVNDPGLYEDARSLVGGANRSRIMRNLIRKTAKDGADEAPEKSK